MYKGWDILTLTFRLAEGEAPITGHQIVKLKDDSTQDDAFEIEVCQDDTELPLGVAQVDEGSEIKAGEVVPVMIRGVSRVIAGAATINPRDTVSPGGFGLAVRGLRIWYSVENTSSTTILAGLTMPDRFA